MKRILCCVLLLLICLSLFAGCGNDHQSEQPPQSSNDDTTTSSSPEAEPEKQLVLAAHGEKAEYILIRPEQCGSELLNSIIALHQKMCDAIENDVTIKDDWYKNESDISACEIIVGNTNRSESSAYTGELGGYDWYVTVVGQKLVINGGSEAAVTAAVEYFMKEFVDGKTEIVVPAGLDHHHVSDTKLLYVTDIKDQLKIIGRYSETSDGITCDWTASGIEFTADCEGEVIVGVNVTKAGNYDGDAYFAVYVDGVRQETRLEAKLGDNQLLLASGLERGVHTFRLLKQSHVAHANTVIQTIAINGTIGDRPADKQHYIEFYGDSITCGFGLASEYVKSVSGTTNGDAYYCDGTKAYAFLAAEELDADYSMVSVSGWRLAGDSNAIPKTCYPFVNWYRGGRKYDFSARVPDVVVINLGTNDFTADLGGTVFAADTEAWIKRIRKDYGKEDLPIIFIINSMNDGYQGALKSKISELGGENAGLYVVKTVLNRSGLSNHPTCAAQAKTAALLEELIRDRGLLK